MKFYFWRIERFLIMPKTYFDFENAWNFFKSKLFKDFPLWIIFFSMVKNKSDCDWRKYKWCFILLSRTRRKHVISLYNAFSELYNRKAKIGYVLQNWKFSCLSFRRDFLYNKFIELPNVVQAPRSVYKRS